MNEVAKFEMKLSIIIPYYNADKWVGRMLDSLLNQNMATSEYEIIVVDDGSKEEPKTLMEYVADHDQIKYIHQENTGPGGARNTGLNVAQGEYVLFCDSDDYVVENVLAKLYETAHSRQLDMLFYDFCYINDDKIGTMSVKRTGRIEEYSSGKDYFASLDKGIIHTSVNRFFIKMEFLKRYKLTFPVYWIMNEDSSFFVDAVMAAGPVASMDMAIYYYVQNPQSLIHQAGRVQQAERFCGNMLLFVRKLTDILNNEEMLETMPPGCVNNLARLRNHKAYVILVTGCKYLPPTKTSQYVSQLRALQAYPKPFGCHKWQKRFLLSSFGMKVMNNFYNIKRASWRRLIKIHA